MNANEARRLVESAVNGPPDITQCVYALDAVIGVYARRGHRRIAPWEVLRGRGEPALTQREKAALEEHYASEGFTWEASLDYPSLSW